MKVTVNGQEHNLDSELSIAALLSHLGYKNSFVAVAINKNCIPRSKFEETTLTPSDQIEILAPMSGG